MSGPKKKEGEFNKMKELIGVIGKGYVGNAFIDMVKDKYDVIARDTKNYYNYSDGSYDTMALPSKNDYTAFNTAKLAVICVPTPMKKNKEADISIVEEAVKNLNVPVILIKSTVPPGTTDYLKKKYKKRIVFSPEFVGEGKYYITPRMDFHTDMKACPWLTLGGDEKDCNYILDLLIPILGPEKRYYKTTAIEAEVAKYMENSYFGVKITFAQEFYDICKTFGADWYKVWQAWSADPRVDVMHTAVFPKARGFSNKCLPKDLNAIVKASKKKGYTPVMLEAMLKSNKEIRRKNGQKLDY